MLRSSYGIVSVLSIGALLLFTVLVLFLLQPSQTSLSRCRDHELVQLQTVVKDTGCGMEHDYLTRIWDAFSQERVRKKLTAPRFAQTTFKFTPTHLFGS
jgi:signal transduction histidine kinase